MVLLLMMMRMMMMVVVVVIQSSNHLRPNSITLSWSPTGPKLVADLQLAAIWPII